MGRVINTKNPTRIRNQNRRTIAEILQRLAHKGGVDDEAKDMAATVVYALREIFTTVESAVAAWEKRDYWIKAERFMQQWAWTRDMAANIEDVIREEAWDLLPRVMMDLYPHFTDVQVKTLTRKPDTWLGAYERLLDDEPQTLTH